MRRISGIQATAQWGSKGSGWRRCDDPDPLTTRRRFEPCSFPEDPSVFCLSPVTLKKKVSVPIPSSSMCKEGARQAGPARPPQLHSPAAQGRGQRRGLPRRLAPRSRALPSEASQRRRGNEARPEPQAAPLPALVAPALCRRAGSRMGSKARRRKPAVRGGASC